jgi:hypothetical protein
MRNASAVPNDFKPMEERENVAAGSNTQEVSAMNVGPRLVLGLLLSLWACGGASRVAEQAASPVPAVPVEPVSAILDAFQTHPIVALGEGPHGNEQGHAFRLALIRDPRFAATVNDIVVECGNGRYQTLMDRFVNGSNVSDDALRHVWQDTTVTTSGCDRPIYEEFFRAVRALNASLTADRRIRVLLGDAPIDWSRVKTREDVHRWGLVKDQHAADVVLKEVLAKHRRALVIYGDGHLQGRDTRDPLHDRLLINILDGPTAPRRVFAITSWFSDSTKIQDGVGAWPVPSLAMLRGTVTGVKPFALFYQLPPAPGWNQLRLEDEFDAMLYLGPASSMTISHLPASLCTDKDYVKMRLARLAFTLPAARKAMTDAFVRGCASLIAR